jgi:hypothetical protein
MREQDQAFSKTIHQYGQKHQEMKDKQRQLYKKQEEYQQIYDDLKRKSF